MEQLAITDLCFTPISQLAREEREHADMVGARLRNLADWLIGTHRCTEDVMPHVERLCREFGRAEAEDRAKCLLAVCTTEGWRAEDAEYVGVYDHGITDYHVLWDRAWAIRMLVPRELVPKVWKCGYGGKPKFWDRDGTLLFQSVYCVDGHVLTSDERLRALTEMGAL